MDTHGFDDQALPGDASLRPDRFTGSVVDGVEHGSVVLSADNGATYQLGIRWQHLVGRRVEVTGRVLLDVMTTAQQGTPLAVDDVTDLGPGALPPNAV